MNSVLTGGTIAAAVLANAPHCAGAFTVPDLVE